jgi:hypothetical protein
MKSCFPVFVPFCSPMSSKQCVDFRNDSMTRKRRQNICVMIVRKKSLARKRETQRITTNYKYLLIDELLWFGLVWFAVSVKAMQDGQEEWERQCLLRLCVSPHSRAIWFWVREKSATWKVRSFCSFGRAKTHQQPPVIFDRRRRPWTLVFDDDALHCPLQCLGYVYFVS